MKIYFAGSIRGGREDAALYARLIAYIQRTDTVLTEHIGNLALSAKEGSKPKSLAEGADVDRVIYEEDSAWLREADMVIAECTLLRSELATKWPMPNASGSLCIFFTTAPAPGFRPCSPAMNIFTFTHIPAKRKSTRSWTKS